MQKNRKTSQYFSIKSTVLLIPVILTGAALFSGCSTSAKQDAAANTGASAAVHPLRGIITDVNAAKGLVTVKNENMPGVMEAMTMPYSLAKPSTLSTLHAGDKISADYSITANGATLDNIKILNKKSK